MTRNVKNTWMLLSAGWLMLGVELGMLVRRTSLSWKVPAVCCALAAVAFGASFLHFGEAGIPNWLVIAIQLVGFVCLVAASWTGYNLATDAAPDDGVQKRGGR